MTLTSITLPSNTFCMVRTASTSFDVLRTMKIALPCDAVKAVFHEKMSILPIRCENSGEYLVHTTSADSRHRVNSLPGRSSRKDGFATAPETRVFEVLAWQRISETREPWPRHPRSAPGLGRAKSSKPLANRRSSRSDERTPRPLPPPGRKRSALH